MNQLDALTELDDVCKMFTPSMPLDTMIASNPYFYFKNYSFDETYRYLKFYSGFNLTMSPDFYIHKLQNGEIDRTALIKALRYYNLDFDIDTIQKNFAGNHLDVLIEFENLPKFLSKKLKFNFEEHKVNYLSFWASSYFDHFLSQWSLRVVHTNNVFADWKEYVLLDKSLDLVGLKNFKKEIEKLPLEVEEILQNIKNQMNIPDKIFQWYCYSTACSTIGWTSYCAGLDWDAHLKGNTSKITNSWILIHLCWDFALMKTFIDGQIKNDWTNYLNKISEGFIGDKFDETIKILCALQLAYDWTHEKKILQLFQEQKISNVIENKKPAIAQMLFCIDVRSEVIRRNIERESNNTIETFGVAGFFGIPIHYSLVAHKHGKNLCPIILNPSYTVQEVVKNSDNGHLLKERIAQGKFLKTWKIFKSGMISAFSYVSSMGLYYLPKLITDSLHLTKPVEDVKTLELSILHDKNLAIDISHIPFEEKVLLVRKLLLSIGLKENFAPYVFIIGHHAECVNNPHASGLDCGACGGNSGLINAIVAAQILNDKEVRKELKNHDINIPDDTLFVAGVHNTTTDAIIFYDTHLESKDNDTYHQMKQYLENATQKSILERSKQFNISGNVLKEIKQRSNDWAQTRPEWGLVNCNMFVIGKRNTFQHVDLNGSSFLHSYDWKMDEDQQLLENIMTGPLVVTNWINMQYYVSTVDPDHFGSGNKTLHNVVGGFGVLEGASGDLRIGLSLQSVHNGRTFQHQPLRLKVLIQAPISYIEKVFEKHLDIKQLFINQWMFLYILNDNGQIEYTYKSNGEWESVEKEKTETRY